jgi:hypothetical protein
MVVDITNMDSLIRGYIISKLQSKFPLIDTSPNSPYDELFIKPMIELVKPFIDRINKIEIKRNLNNAEDMEDAELDEVGNGNYLISRHSGSPASTSLTLSFANLNINDPLFSLKVPAGTIFSTSSGLQYQNKFEVPILVEDLRKGYNKIKMVYEIDIPVESIGIGAKYNVGVGEIITCTNSFSTALVGVINKVELKDGKDKEDNISYANRIKQFYISRQLGTDPGYKSFIRESFPEVQDIYVAGYKDPYMTRDLLKVYDDVTQQIIQKHVGGMVDIYIRGFLLSQVDATVTVNSSLIILPVKYDNLYDKTNIASNIALYNLTDESKQPVILSISKVSSTEYDGKYTDNTKIIIDNANNKSYDATDVSSFKITYVYSQDGVRRMDEMYTDIGISKTELSVPIKSINSLIVGDDAPLTSIADKYQLTQSGLIGTTDEQSEIVLVNMDDVPNGTAVTVEYTINDTLSQMSNIFNQKEFRIVTADLICREATAVPVNIQFRVKTTNNRKLDGDIKSKIQSAVINFFNTYTLGSQIEESDIVSWIYSDTITKDLIQYIALPFDVFYIPQSITEEVPLDGTQQAPDGVLPIQAIQYPVLNTTRFSVTTV